MSLWNALPVNVMFVISWFLHKQPGFDRVTYLHYIRQICLFKILGLVF